MPPPPPPQPPVPLSQTQPLLDSLTSHIALYHSRSQSPSPSPSNPNPNPRSSILRHLHSLPIPSRQSLLTFTSPSFLHLLLKMRARHPQSLFFLLHDLPSSNSAPSLLSRRPTSLISRHLSLSPAISDSILLFGSENEEVLDSVTVTEGLVADVERFVEVMDGVTGGRFLVGEEAGLGEEWKEMGWFKDRGYFSLDEFVANRLEVFLRRKWKGRGRGKGKGKWEGESSSVFWRKKGSVDWWEGVGDERRRAFCQGFLGKAAKLMASEIVAGPNIVSRNELGLLDVDAEGKLRRGPTSSLKRSKMPCYRSDSDVDTITTSGMPNHFVKLLNRLLVVQEISAILLACRLNKIEKETLFFSRLGSALTISDCIMRKLRGLIMVVSIDYISRELLGDQNVETHLTDEKKLNVASRKGKKKSRNSKQINSLPIQPRVDSTSEEHPKSVDSYILCHQQDNCSVSTSGKTKTGSTYLLPKDRGKDHAIGLVDCKGLAERKRNGGKRARRKNLKKVVMPETENKTTSAPTISPESKVADSVEIADPPALLSKSGNSSVKDTLSPILSYCETSHEPRMADGHEMADNFEDVNCASSSVEEDEKTQESSSSSSVIKVINHEIVCEKQFDTHANSSGIKSILSVATGNARDFESSRLASGDTSNSTPVQLVQVVMAEQNGVIHNAGNSIGGTSFEWPSTTPSHLTSASSPQLPAATDMLHLEVGYRHPNRFRQSFVPLRHQPRNSSVEGGHGIILPSLNLPMSYDWPLVVNTCSRLGQAVTMSYDSSFNPSLPPSFCPGIAPHTAHRDSGDIFDMYDMKTASELPDDTESYWLSEEESEAHAFSGRDYNQFFGGGVMYWNPAEHVGTGFSRPPSHSSEDSSWAWYEADINRAIDDMVGVPGLPASYNTNGLTSPPAASFCSPFDSLGPGPHQPDVPDDISSISLNSLSACVEGGKGDLLPYPRLRPIIVPSISRKGSRSEFNNHDHNSPCLPSSRRDHPRIKRPPSPVVLCVPRVPRPPPPSPVSESRKRGFPIVRSGSSSPRHWGMRNCYREDGFAEDPRLCLDGAEVVWPSWGSKGIGGTPVAHSLQGSLLQDHLITLSQLACDQEHPDVALPLQPADLLNCTHKAFLPVMHNQLHEEIDFFCKQVAADNLMKKPYINWAIKRVTRSLQVLWPRSRTNIFGSNATGLALPTSDVDLVVSLPPVRNLEPIKEAGILEGRNGIKETCLQHAARYLANQDWVRNDSLKTIENTAIPVIMLVAEVPEDINYSNGKSSIMVLQDAEPTNSCKLDHTSSEDTSLARGSKVTKDGGIDVKSIRLDISFKSSSHTGLRTSQLVRELTQQFPASIPLALVLKKFLADRSLDHSYSGGLSSYCLVLLITRFLQHKHHIGQPINQNLGSLLMDFLYFFGNVFDPRHMRISIQGSGVYMNRERGLSIDPIHIDDPLFPSNNVGRNCFRIHQCIKAFADAYSVLENELSQFSGDCQPSSSTSYQLLRKIISSIDRHE